MNEDFCLVSLFRNTEKKNFTITEDIVAFFAKAEPGHYSLMLVAFFGICALCMLVLLNPIMSEI